MKKLIVSLLLVSCISACAIDKQTLGLGRRTPDEFTVITRKPLSLPPEYNVTPPVNKGITSSNISNEVKNSVLGEKDSINKLNNEDKSFLSTINADSSDKNIREELTNNSNPANNRKVVNKIMFWKNKDNSTIIDNAEEAKRLKENKKQGYKINNGNVPVIEPKK
ncbi:MAG: DUF3035 domain-containing protein [Alphaproteobacteria bacterium]|nr:DUF3035 domain-containing protein [Alphaproteobacteria bacterium]